MSEEQIQQPECQLSNGDKENNQKGFNLARVHQHFTQSLLDNQEVHLIHYCDAWHELNR